MAVNFRRELQFVAMDRDRRCWAWKLDCARCREQRSGRREASNLHGWCRDLDRQLRERTIFGRQHTARGKKALRRTRAASGRVRAARRYIKLGDADAVLRAAVFGPRLLPDAFAEVRDFVAPKPEPVGDGDLGIGDP